jgi:glycerol kinase
MERESGRTCRAAGRRRASANDLLCQFQADVLGVPWSGPHVQETTVMGAAFLAGLGAGVWRSTDELRSAWQLDARFEPTMDAPTRRRLMRGWHEAVDRSKGWAHVVEGE